jgi:hypothetical protein
MYFSKNIIQNLLIISLIINISLCQKLQKDLLGGWGEIKITNRSSIFSKVLEATEKYFVSEGYSLDETDILPFGFFKQTLGGINYRLLCAIKKKSSDNPTIYDILLHQSNNELKIASTKKPDYSSSNMSPKDKNKMEDAILKYYFDKLYFVKALETQYEYHKLDGLYKYAVFDILTKVGKKNDENITKRLLIVYRNDKTFIVEKEVVEKE